MKSLSCYQEHMSRCAPAVTEMFELVKSMFNNNNYMHVVVTASRMTVKCVCKSDPPKRLIFGD